MTPRRALWFSGTVALAATIAAVVWYFTADVTLPPPVQRVADAPPNPADFVGAERCASCHVPQYQAWRASTHGRAGGAASSATVIAPFSGAAILLADAQVTPRVRGGSWEFSVAQSGEPERVLKVDGVVGGGHMIGGGTQAFVTRIGGTLRVLPFEWSRQARAWFCNTNSRAGRGWSPITRATRLADCGDWPPVRVLGDVPRFANCQSCHASQAVVTLDSAGGGYATTATSLAINCEACHGPARRHVELAEKGTLTTADIGLASLASLDKDGSLGVCWQCHAVKDQTRPGFVSGRPLADYYSTKFPLLGDRPLHPDGRTRTFAYQEGHLYSACYLRGGMTCTSCHDPHSQGYRSVAGEPLTGRFDDRQCLSCHASKAADIPAHTKHAATSTGSRCVACHMPFRQQPETRAANARDDAHVVAYARSDHTISIPRPALDSLFGMASACSGCHPGAAVATFERQISAWWGETRPLAPQVAAQRAAGIYADVDAAEARRLLLDSGSNAMATFAGLARFLESYVDADRPLDDDARQRLQRLASDRDVDVRAAALAALHLADGGDRDTRRALARALRTAGDSDAALRERWALALGFKADRYAASRSTNEAVIAYRRALEVQPRNARLLLNLANSLRDGGDLTAALGSYRASVGLDAASPLAWVNYGLALGASGDTAGAIDAFTRAARLDQSETLAWYNLGNISFVRNDLDRAAALYERAVATDPGLTLGHFQLARIALMRRDEGQALRHLRHGLAFDSSDASAREMAAELSKRKIR